MRLGEDDNYATLYEQHNPTYLESENGTPTISWPTPRTTGSWSTNGRGTAGNGTWERTWTLSGDLDWPRDADRLANGNTLVVDSMNNRVDRGHARRADRLGDARAVGYLRRRTRGPGRRSRWSDNRRPERTGNATLHGGSHAESELASVPAVVAGVVGATPLPPKSPNSRRAGSMSRRGSNPSGSDLGLLGPRNGASRSRRLGARRGRLSAPRIRRGWCGRSGGFGVGYRKSTARAFSTSLLLERRGHRLEGCFEVLVGNQDLVGVSRGFLLGSYSFATSRIAAIDADRQKRLDVRARVTHRSRGERVEVDVAERSPAVWTARIARGQPRPVPEPRRGFYPSWSRGLDRWRPSGWWRRAPSGRILGEAVDLSKELRDHALGDLWPPRPPAMA